jgi:DNA-binding transcriptional LysR family regulator
MLGHLPSIENLQCFVAAAEHLNFRRAAKAMSLTPTAFGQRIKQLEEQLGQPLFLRTTRHVELTDSGRRLLGAAHQTLGLAQTCLDSARAEESPPAVFSLGTRFELGNSWILPALSDLRSLEPSWTIELYFGSGSDILNRLRLGHLDCVITSAPVARKDWVMEYLHPEDYVFVASKEVLERNPFEVAADASHHTLLDTNADLPLTRYLTSAGPELVFSDVWLCGSTSAMHLLALDGHGVCVLPRHFIAADLDSGRLIPILEEYSLLSDSFRLIFRRSTTLTTVFQRFAEFMRGRPLQ